MTSLVVVLLLWSASTAVGTWVELRKRKERALVDRALRCEVGLLSAEFNEWADSIKVAAAEPAGWLAGKLQRRLVVHTSDDQSIEGLLDTVAPDGVVLRAARLLGEKTVALAGDVWVARARIVFVQTVPVEEAPT